MANVLIIDDEEMLCDIMCEHLKGEGHDVTYALTLEDGLNKGVSGPFGLWLAWKRTRIDQCLRANIGGRPFRSDHFPQASA